MWIRSPATCARSGATAMSVTAPGRSRPRWKGRASPRPGGASAASCANRACGRAHAQTIQTARDAGQRGQAREPTGPRVRRLRAAHASGERPDVRARRRQVGVRVPAGRLGEQGHREKSSQGWTLLGGLEDCFSYHAAPVHLLLCNKYETVPYHTQVFRNIFAHIQCSYSSLLLSAGIKGSKSFTGRDSLK